MHFDDFGRQRGLDPATQRREVKRLYDAVFPPKGPPAQDRGWKTLHVATSGDWWWAGYAAGRDASRQTWVDDGAANATSNSNGVAWVTPAAAKQPAAVEQPIANAADDEASKRRRKAEETALRAVERLTDKREAEPQRSLGAASAQAAPAALESLPSSKPEAKPAAKPMPASKPKLSAEPLSLEPLLPSPFEGRLFIDIQHHRDLERAEAHIDCAILDHETKRFYNTRCGSTQVATLTMSNLTIPVYVVAVCRNSHEIGNDTMPSERHETAKVLNGNIPNGYPHFMLSASAFFVPSSSS